MINKLSNNTNIDQSILLLNELFTSINASTISLYKLKLPLVICSPSYITKFAKRFTYIMEVVTMFKMMTITISKVHSEH